MEVYFWPPSPISPALHLLPLSTTNLFFVARVHFFHYFKDPLSSQHVFFLIRRSFPLFLHRHVSLFFSRCAFKTISLLLREGSSTPLQDSCLENPMDRGAWWAAVHGVTRSQTRLSDFTFTFHLHALEKEVATHSSALAWRIPGTAEPGGLPSVGWHRVGHDWSNLAAALFLVLSSLIIKCILISFSSVSRTWASLNFL